MLESLTVWALYIQDHGRVIAAAAGVLLALLASCHIIINRRDYRAALWWVGVVWVTPVIGVLLYYHFGINRIRRRRLSARRGSRIQRKQKTRLSDNTPPPYIAPVLNHLYALSRLVDKVADQPLTKGNAVTPLATTHQAYAAMLEAIDRARTSVSLTSYIFLYDGVGRAFVEALASARSRGVQVRVLMDDVGSAAWGRSVPRELRRRNIPHANFLPSFSPWRFSYLNMRSHRKIMVVDGHVGFTGSMNIVEGPIQDIFFRLEGPVVAHLQDSFGDDWFFCTGETLKGEAWYPALHTAGGVMARGIADGPDDNIESLRIAILGALAQARSSIKIVTPYFVPDMALLTSLTVAAMSGVNVEILLPEENDLAMVRWASMPNIFQALERGCKVWVTPPPFDHSKIMVVDQEWTMFGSSNWDTRSLRLNFEFNVECYSQPFAAQVEEIIEGKKKLGRHMTLGELERRPLPIKLRDATARLFTPHI